MAHRIRVLALTLSLVGGTAAAARAQSSTQTAPRPKHETQAKLRAEAKISEDSARTLARREVPDGKIVSSELEREHGKLIYSFDVKVAGKSGVEEINIDAISGSLVAHEHESAKAEAKEAKDEAKEAKDEAKQAKPPFTL